MTSDEQLRDLIDRENARLSENLDLAIKRGGLPTEAEAEEVDTYLQHAFDRIESLAFRIAAISHCDADDDMPTITLEQLGVVAVLAGYIDERAKDFAKVADQIRHHLSHDLNVIRCEQAYQQDARRA